MTNLRIIHDNAADRATLTASSQAGTLGPANLLSERKSAVLRATALTQRITAAWPTPEAIDGVFLPFCNLSPTATMRVRTTNEPSTTNLLKYSGQMDNAVWALGRMGPTVPNAAVAPDGTLTADKIVPTSALGVSHYLDYQVAGLPDNTIYSASVFVKRGDFPRVMLQFISKTVGSDSIEIDLDSGRVTRTAVAAGSSATFDATPVGDGWWRLYVRNTPSGTGAGIPRFRIFPSANPVMRLAFSKGGCTVLEDTSILSPVAGWPVERLLEDTTSGSHYASGNVFSRVNKAVVLECYARPLGTGATRYLSLVAIVGSGLAVTQSFTVNIETGAITSQSVNIYTKNITVTAADNGWWKIRCEITPTLNGSFSWQIRLNNTSNTSIASYVGDGASGAYVCQPYAYWLIPDSTLGPCNWDGAAAVAGDGTTQGGLAWGAQLELGPVCTSYYPSVATPGVRPAGYMDNWQTYDYDSGAVLACPAPAIRLRNFSAAAAASAYAFGGGAYARHWLPVQMQALGMTVEITDAANLQGYAEVSRLVVSAAWSPANNADYGAGLQPLDMSENYRSGGDLCSAIGTRSRKLTLNLSNMPGADRSKLAGILRRNGVTTPLLISVFPGHADLELERDYTLYAKLSQLSAMTLPYFDAYSTPLEFEEV